MIKGKKMLVVSAHAADYVWRAGGTIAKYIKEGADVHVVVLSFGGRGESNDLWKMEGATAESVKSIRKQETIEAANILGIKNIEFWDMQDYPMTFNSCLLYTSKSKNSDMVNSMSLFFVINCSITSR